MAAARKAVRKSRQKEFYGKYMERADKATLRSLPILWKIFSPLGVEGKRVLDVGCGAGSLLSLFAGKNELYGIDLSQGSVELARKKGIDARVADAERRLPFESNYFDFVICKDVFEHLRAPEFTLKEISRVLKKNAFLFALVPNEFNFLARLRILFGRGLVSRRWFAESEQWNYPHLRFFTRRGFREFLERHGFRVLRDYSSEWCYLRMKPLSILFPSLFSPGIAFLAVNSKKPWLESQGVLSRHNQGFISTLKRGAFAMPGFFSKRKGK